MSIQKFIHPAVASLQAELKLSAKGSKRLKLRTLLAKFGHSKRSDTNTADITHLLSEAGLAMHPPILRLGKTWEIGLEDWIYLSIQENENEQKTADKVSSEVPSNWNADRWFDRIGGLDLRTEKEVEIKFIVPLLCKLGYTENDRYDGMPVPAAHGSRDTTLVIDFALFNSELESLRNQPLLIVEAKRENRLKKRKELASAHNQAKSYCLWTQCDFFMVTDSRTLHAYQVARGRFGELSPIFSCEREELINCFPDLYRILSKDALTKHYLPKLVATEEVS